MTFDPNVPNASQSPGLFPTQNNTNYARLKTIINADHVFNDTAQSTDGVHRQCTMIARAQPVGLPTGTNSILYSWIDANGAAQLRFYNGATDTQITPLAAAVTRITGTVALAGNATSGTVWTIPANTFAWVFVNYVNPAGNFWRLYYVYCSGPGYVAGDILKDSPNTSRPAINFSGNNMRVVNGNSNARTVAYYVMAASV